MKKAIHGSLNSPTTQLERMMSFLPLSRIDAVLGQDQGHPLCIRGAASQDAGVTGGDGMVNVRLWDLLREDIHQREVYPPEIPEKVEEYFS